MTRQEMIDNLIANCSCWDEDDRRTLNRFEDEKLRKLNKQLVENAALRGAAELVGNEEAEDDLADEDDDDFDYDYDSIDNAEYDDDDEEDGLEDDPDFAEEDDDEVENMGPPDQGDEESDAVVPPNKKSKKKGKMPMAQNMSEQDWMRQAPPRLRRMVANHERWEANQKEQFIEQITANEANRFKPSFLRQLPLEHLQAMAELANNGQPQRRKAAPTDNGLMPPNYVGNGSFLPAGQGGGDDSKQYVERNVLVVPTVNWGADEDAT